MRKWLEYPLWFFSGYRSVLVDRIKQMDAILLIMNADTWAGWALVALLGFVDIILQILIPDLVPDVINNLITSSSNYAGVKPVFEAFLFLYIVGGYILFWVDL